MINPPITNTAITGMPPSQAGVAAAVASTSRQVGATLGVAVLGALAGGDTIQHLGPSFATATHTSWWVVVGIGCVLLVGAFVTTTPWALRTATNTAERLRDRDRPPACRAARRPSRSPPPLWSDLRDTVRPTMELVTRDRPNVSLRRHGDGGHWVVLSFPYDAHLVNLARSIPHRRFDWDTREWSAPVTDWAGIRVQDILERYPELEASDEVAAWLKVVKRRWIGSVSTARHDGRGWWVLHTIAGPLPEELSDSDLLVAGGRQLLALTAEAGRVLAEQPSARLDAGAERCLQLVRAGAKLPPARLAWVRGVEGEELRLEVVWDPDVGVAFEDLAASEGTRSVTLDPWITEELDAFIVRARGRGHRARA